MSTSTLKRNTRYRFPGAFDSLQSRFVISGRLLLSYYAVIPLCLLVVIGDQLLWSGTLLDNYLPQHPNEWLIWAVVFDLPHIMASFFSFADKEYFRTYRRRIGTATLVITVFVVACTVWLPSWLPPPYADAVTVFFAGFIVIYTMYHVLSQQLGIALTLMRVKPSALFRWFRWSATLAGVAMYTLAIANGKSLTLGVQPLNPWFWNAALVFIIITTVLSFYMVRDSSQRVGKLYLYSNVIMLWVIYGFLQLGYGVFVVVIPRFVHDVTAFTVYSVHDHNRNVERDNNFLYRPFRMMSPLVFCPLLAVVLSYLVENGLSFIPQLVFVLGILHYYVEGFIWKGPTLHRQQLSFC